MTRTRATECLIKIDEALRIKRLLKNSGHSVSKLFLCKHCKRPVKALELGHAEGSGRTSPSHFEHLKRNLDCPLSEKSKAKQLYAKYKASKRQHAI
jgi:hypothetical protein